MKANLKGLVLAGLTSSTAFFAGTAHAVEIEYWQYFLAQFALAMHIGRWAGVQRLRQGRRAALGVWARQRDETIADSCRDTW